MRRPALIILALLLLIIAPVTMQSAFSKGGELPDTYVSHPLMCDVAWCDTHQSTMIESSVDHEIMIKGAFVSKLDTDVSYLIIAEVRDQNGISQFLEVQSGTFTPANEETGYPVHFFSWQPNMPGLYEARIFAISNFSKPIMLTDIRKGTAEIS